MAWRSSEPRDLRSPVVEDHGGSLVSRPFVIDQTRLLGPTTLPDDPVEGDGRRRAVHVVLLYGLAASVAVAVAVLGTAAAQRATSASPIALATVGGLAFVATTSLVLWWALRRWADRLTTATEVERRAAENLSEVTRIRAAFLDSISHELRTPLTNILGFSQTIRTHHRTLTPEHVEQFSDRLVINATRLEGLVVDLLELHRDGLRAPLTENPVHVEQLLRGAVAATGSRGQQLYVWSPVQWVAVDRDRLERIVSELISNVVRHTPAGTVAWLQATTHDGWLHLGIEDDGPGVDEEIIDQVSQPFVQGADARHSPSPGLGIGLALAARYAEFLGGRLTISRPATCGTRVDVMVPCEPITTNSVG